MVEQLALIAFGTAFPVNFRGLKQRERTHHIGARERERFFDGTVDVALGGKMYDAVHFVFLHQRKHTVIVTYVGAHEGVVGTVLYVLEIGEIAGIRQFIDVDYVVIRIFVDKQAHHVRAYESGAAGDYDIALHC